MTTDRGFAVIEFADRYGAPAPASASTDKAASWAACVVLGWAGYGAKNIHMAQTNTSHAAPPAKRRAIILQARGCA